MALTHLTFSEKRLKWISAIENQLLNYRIYYSYVIGGNGASYQNAINELFQKGILVSKDLDENVEEHFGKPENKEDFDWKIAKILFLHYMVKCLPFLINEKKIQETKMFLKTIENNLSSYANDYSFSFPDDNIASFEPTELKTITDNLSDIPSNLADPIKELLQPNKSDTELRGHINEVYAKIERFNFDDLSNLNQVDKSIARKTWEFSKMLVNSVDSAKGHEGQSELTVRDIAHNFSLNVSLFWKLVEKNNK